MNSHFPTPVVLAGDDGVLRTTSINIAEFIGQTHTLVRTTIQIAMEEGAFFGTNDIRLASDNDTYELTRDGTTFILARIGGRKSTQWLMEYIKTFNRMAEALASRKETITPTLPPHLARYLANKDNVPVGHFSALTETTLLLMGVLESEGYQLPENMLPDVSVGHWFCEFLRGEGYNTKSLPRYRHTYSDRRGTQWPKAYPEELLHKFRKWFRDDWLINHAERYFEERDPVALSFLPSVLRSSIPKPYSRGPCESPIEQALLNAVQRVGDKLEFMTQAQIGKYRADLLIFPHLVVECDGHASHEKTPEQASRDKERDRWMLRHGFFVFRFTGTDITHRLPKCVGEICDFIKNNRFPKRIPVTQISTLAP